MGWRASRANREDAVRDASAATAGDPVPGPLVAPAPGMIDPQSSTADDAAAVVDPVDRSPVVEPDATNPVDPVVPGPVDDTFVAPSRPATEKAPHSRVGGVWVSAVLFALLLLLLLIFVLENGQRAEISFFGQHGHLPQGVALLLAAVCGILLVAIPGTARIVQLRLRDRHHRKVAAKRPPAA